MKATLIYNHDAGPLDSTGPDQLQEALQKAGYQPVYEATSSVDDLDAILEDITGLVVSAGGDGTAKAIAIRLLGNQSAAITILPMGTANNLVRTLQIEGTPLEIIERLREPVKRQIDVGKVSAPWGMDYFIEGAGLGFFAQVLATYEPENGKSITRSVQALVEVLREGYGQTTTIKVNGEEISTEFLLVEILNTHSVGPRLKFAPDADPTDGLLNVVCIDGQKREGYFQYLRSMLQEQMDELPSVSVYKASELEIEWKGFPFHVDDYVRPLGFDFRPQDQSFPLRQYPYSSQDNTIRVNVLPQALNLWLPQDPEGKGNDHED